MTSATETTPPRSPGKPPSRWQGLGRSVVLPLAILGLIVGGLWYWDSRGGGSAIDDGYGIVELPLSRNPTGESPSPEVGRAGPDFLLERPGGGELRLSDLQGRPVLLNFWASWCPPCRQEMPDLVDAHGRFRDDGLVVVGVNLQEPDSTVLRFAEEFGIAFPLAIDRAGGLADVWRLGGPIEGIPTSYFLDETGVVRDVFYGPMTEEDIDEGVGAALEGGA